MEENKTKTIYLVVSCYGGGYTCYHEEPECSFVDKTEARKYAEKRDRELEKKPVFPENIWSDIELSVESFFENEGELTNPYEGGTREWENWEKDFQKYEREMYLHFVHEYGFKTMTIIDVDKQFEYEKFKDREYRETRVKELTLVL